MWLPYEIIPHFLLAITGVTISKFPDRNYFKENEQAVLQCVGTQAGSDTLSYQWKRKGVFHSNNNPLTIQTGRSENGVVYECTVTGSPSAETRTEQVTITIACELYIFASSTYHLIC